MAIGFVLINVTPTLERKVFETLSKIQEIKELYQLFGEYDIIAKVETKDYESLGDIVVNTIRSVQGVLNTKTLTAINC
ncbi:MAG: Lrp/AsnC ligand binding domain-containing protein [Candidatus Thermoplasmatota archaeon]